MFLLPSVALGIVLALVLGGRPSRLLDVELRRQWLVLAALALQIVLFSRAGSGLAAPVSHGAHLGSYALLLLFAASNVRVRALWPVLLGLVLNATAIAANGGVMPVAAGAARSVGLARTGHANVSLAAAHLRPLGDVFALPRELPLANVFSVGDILIGFGMIAFIVLVATADGRGRVLSGARLVAPLRVRGYRRLAAGKLVSQVGDWLTVAALIGWIYERTGSTAQVAALMLIRLAPPIVGSSVAVFLVDRLPKRRILIAVELARGAAVAGALVGVVTDTRAAVFAALACSGLFAALSAAAAPALVPSLLPDDQLPAANAGLGIAKDVAMGLGAGAGGLALASVGAPAALLLDLATFAVAAALYLGVPPARAAAAAEASERLLTGLRYLLRRRRLVVVIVSFTAATFATGLTNASLPRFLDGHAGLGPGGYGYGIAALAAGLALGECLVGFTRVGPAAGRWIGAGLLAMAALFAVLALERHAPTALLLLGAIGFVDGTTDVLFETTLQREADPSRYGCVFGFASSFMTTTMLAAIAVAPLANSLFAPGGVLLAAGGALVVAGVIALVGLRTRPERAASLRPALGRD